MQVDLKALDADIRSNTYPFFTSRFFNGRLENGWIKTFKEWTKYIYFLILADIIFNGIMFGVYNEEFIETTVVYNGSGAPKTVPTLTARCYAYSCIALAVSGVLLLIGMYLMGDGILLRNIKNQEWSLKAFTYFLYIQLAVWIVNYALSPKKPTAGTKSISIIGFICFILGAALKLIAHRMRDEMLDVPDSEMEEFYKVIYKYPRFFSDIERIPLTKEPDLPL